MLSKNLRLSLEPNLQGTAARHYQMSLQTLPIKPQPRPPQKPSHRIYPEPYCITQSPITRKPRYPSVILNSINSNAKVLGLSYCRYHSPYCIINKYSPYPISPLYKPGVNLILVNFRRIRISKPFASTVRSFLLKKAALLQSCSLQSLNREYGFQSHCFIGDVHPTPL